MKRMLFILTVIGFIYSCGSEKKSLSDEQIATVEEFVESFPDVKLPLMIHDSILSKKANDSFRIADKVFKQFVPDSIYKSDFKGAKPKFYGIGKVKDKNEDHYVFISVQSSSKKIAYLLCFDKEKQFKAGMSLMAKSKRKDVSFEGGMDRKFNIYRNSYRKGKDGQQYYTRNAFVYNTAGMFTLILNESNDIPEEEEIYNPIDTLPRTMKNTGDYGKDKRNFVSVRNGAKPGKLLFFVHFEKADDCIGELKGELSMVDTRRGVYSEPGDPCSLELEFTANSVSLKELKGCGNYRGIKCFFDGEYPKRAAKRKK